MGGYIENADSCANGLTILSTPLVYFISGLSIVLVQLCILGILKRSRHLASKGDKQASNILVLPIYYIAVLYLALLGILTGFDDMFGFDNRKIPIVLLKWGLARVAFETLSLFLTHNGIGIQPLKRSLVLGILWAFFSSIVPLIFFRQIGWNGYLISFSIFILLLSGFYCCLWLAPPKWIHRRPALKSSSKYFFLSLFFFGVAHICLYFKNELEIPCLIEIIFLITDLFQPLILFYAMHRDSQFWQGLATPDVNLSSNLNEPLLGVWELGRETIGVVGESIAHLETHTVPIIPFGVLQLDTTGYFPGGSARVYQGLLNQDKVAVKILFCIELTPDRVKSFCSEASMLHSLAHSNIVHCHGVAVMPPAICLITEWCHHGSLYDLLHTSEYFIRDDSTVGRPSSVLSNKLSLSRQSVGRSSFNIRMAQDDSECDAPDSLIENETNSPLTHPTHRNSDDFIFLEDRRSVHIVDAPRGSTNHRMRPQPSTDRTSLTITTNDLRVISTKFQTVSRASLPSLRMNIFENHPSTANSHPGEDLFDVEDLRQKDPSTEIELEKQNSSGSRIGRGLLVKRLKSAATVMQSSIMGFGFGTPTEPSPQSSITPRDAKSIGRLLVTADNTVTNLGYCLPMSLRLRMIRDCCAGVAFLHSKGLMHCDIKSLNFLVTNDFVVKLSDLGEARPYKGVTQMDRGVLPKNINWSAPEILVDNGNIISEVSDVWSLAVVAAEILTGEIPFDSPHCRQMSVETFVDALGNDLRPTLPTKLESWIRDAINAGWRYDVESRCSAQKMANIFNEKVSSGFFAPPLELGEEIQMGDEEKV